MWYIVFRDEFKSYGFDQGGYFVSYRDKCSDLYSPNWFEAKKYKSIGSALSRLRITIAPGMDTNEKFLAANKKINNIQSRRDIKLKGILGEDLSIIDYIFADGRIEKIGDNGELILHCQKRKACLHCLNNEYTLKQSSPAYPYFFQAIAG